MEPEGGAVVGVGTPVGIWRDCCRPGFKAVFTPVYGPQRPGLIAKKASSPRSTCVDSY
jgi:hypothetical protein